MVGINILFIPLPFLVHNECIDNDSWLSYNLVNDWFNDYIVNE